MRTVVDFAGRVRPIHLLSLLMFALCAATPAGSSARDLGYQVPSDDLVQVIDASPTPFVTRSPNDDWLMLIQPPNLPPIAELAQEELRLAGYRINPRTNGPSRQRHAESASLVRIEDGKAFDIKGLPENARLGNVAWSANGEFVALTNTVEDGIELWMVDLDARKAKRLLGPRLSLTANLGPVWTSDSEDILVALVPEGRGDAPQLPRAPSGPTVQENLGRATPARTYQDLLKNEHDSKLFEYYFTSQFARVDRKGKLTLLGEPSILDEFDPSPDGQYLLVETLHRPFSYLVPASRFPRRVEVLDRDGRRVKELIDKPLLDAIPIAFGSVATGPRNFGWRADAPATLVWSEAQDDGDAGAEAEVRDKVFALEAPFRAKPRELATLGLRYGGMYWGTGDLALAVEWWWPTRTQRVWRLHPDDADRAPELVTEYSWEDRYNHPGSPMTHWNAQGRSVLKTADGGNVLFLIGDGASEDGDRPFLDRFDLRDKSTTRLFRSEAPFYERPIDVLDEEGDRVLTRREAVEEAPNYFVRRGDELRAVTSFAHPTPQFLGVHKEMIRYEREDGVTLSGTLYLPPKYDAERDGPLPVVLWAYPTEYKSAEAASQVTDSPYRFARVGWWSPMLWLLQGYAVLDDPTMPIIGEGDDEPNDTYIDQLVASAAAAIDELVARGVGDRARMAIGGHSYGAFMTANLLAHSDLFAAGIARSGAYNRTLTPFGFQAEERNFWEASDVYFAMSPFMHADKVNEPLLLIHGEADNNSGTFPMQSERYYSALKGLGATTRLVMLPHESHGYRARESILHMLHETERWLELYVKGEALPDGLQRSTGASAPR